MENTEKLECIDKIEKMEKTEHKKRYTLGEEIFNSISHGVGALLGIAALVLAIIMAAIYQGNAWAIVSAAIYGSSLILLFLSSTLYHALAHPTAKKVFRSFDHSTIFLLIAGTYTPITLVTLDDTSLGFIKFGILWGLAILGIVLNSISIEKFKVLSMILYVGMGWAAIFMVMPLIERMAVPALIMLLIGGILYTGGISFYAIKKWKYMHSIWHLFVLAGSVVQFFAILLYVYMGIG